MSGHSKWATTKNKKEAADAKKANFFTKFGRLITLAAKKGGDPATNFSLRLAIDKAKGINMPKENIERAIKRGTGEEEGVNYEENLYEMFGQEGVAILVESVTDNRNRTVSDLKAILNKMGGSMAGQNAVKWMFEHKGIIHISELNNIDRESLILEVIDQGADDVAEEDGGLTIYCSFENFERVKKFLESKILVLEYAEVEWLAKEKVSVAGEPREKLDKLIEALEDNDDVNNVFTNLNV